MANYAKYCETCQNKNRDKIREREKDSKQFTREYLRCCDTENYEEQKRKDLGRKRFAKERKEKETAAVASMDQNQESTSTPLSAFKHKQTKFRSSKKGR